MKRYTKWLAGGLALIIAGSVIGFKASDASDGRTPPPAAGRLRRAYWRALGIRTAELRLRVVDSVTRRGINGAGCVVGETRDRVETDANGVAPMIDAPVFRNPRLEQMLAELHGQLTVICYKNGYRDAINIGVRMHQGSVTEHEVWMYRYGPEDRRIEPTLYQAPIHRIWQVRLADRYRLRDEGEGPERPQLSRPDVGQVAPQEPEGGGIQTPIQHGPATAPAPAPAPGRTPTPTPSRTPTRTPSR